MSDLFERMIEREIDSANDHLPLRKLSLEDVLTTEIPEFLTRGGENSRFLEDELIWLRREVPSSLHSSFMIPIVILRRMDLGVGIYTIAGSKTELFLIHRIIGHVDLGWDRIREWKPIERLARPQVQLLRRKLPSTTVIGFTTAFARKKNTD